VSKLTISINKHQQGLGTGSREFTDEALLLVSLSRLVRKGTDLELDLELGSMHVNQLRQ
jgi:hypothetical protein